MTGLGLSYDEDDLLDESSIIKIIDLHFSMGKISELKLRFKQERMRHLKSRDINKYIACVVSFDKEISNQLDINLSKICKQHNINKSIVR
jgi:hypothetical protein